MSESYPLHLMNKKPNFYGFSGLDRAAHTRLDDEWFEKILQQGNAKAILSWRSQSMVDITMPDKPSASILELESLGEIIQKADNIVFLGEKKGDAILFTPICHSFSEKLDLLAHRVLDANELIDVKEVYFSPEKTIDIP